MALLSKPLPSPRSNSFWKVPRVPEVIGTDKADTDTTSRPCLIRNSPSLAATPAKTKVNGESATSTSQPTASRPRIGHRLISFTRVRPSSKHSFVSRVEVAAGNLGKWVLPPSRIPTRFLLPYATPKHLPYPPVDENNIGSVDNIFPPEFAVKPQRPGLPLAPLQSDDFDCCPRPTAMEGAPHDLPQASLLGCIESIVRSMPARCAQPGDKTASTSTGQTRDIDVASVLELDDAEAAVAVANVVAMIQTQGKAKEDSIADAVIISTAASVDTILIPVKVEDTDVEARIATLNAWLQDIDQVISRLDRLDAALESTIADSRSRFPPPAKEMAIIRESEDNQTTIGTRAGGDEMLLADAIDYLDVVLIEVLQDPYDKSPTAPAQLITVVLPVVPIFSHRKVLAGSSTKPPLQSSNKISARSPLQCPASPSRHLISKPIQCSRHITRHFSSLLRPPIVQSPRHQEGRMFTPLSDYVVCG